MEVTNSLLVSLMFITILTLGIANILTSIATTVEQSAGKGLGATFDGLHTSWVLLMLLSHFNLFWHTIDILEKDAWEFEGFLFAIAGPILMFVATQVLLSSSPLADGASRREHYFAAAKPFFSLFALVQIWTICVDFVLGRGMTGAASINLICIIIAAALIAWSSVRVHVAGTVFAWLVCLSGAVLRGGEVIN